VTNEQIYTEERPPSSGNAAHSAGLVTSAADFYRSYKRHDGTGMVVSASAFTTNAAGLVLRTTKTGQKVIERLGEMMGTSSGDDGAELIEGMTKSPNYLETASKIAGPALAAASVAYQTYKEDGHFINADGTLGHKSQRLIASSLTAGTSLGVGALLGTGTAPFVLVAATGYEVNKAADIAIDTSRIYEGMDKRTSNFFKPTKLTTRPNSDMPSLAAYKNLQALGYVTNHMRDDHLSTTPERVPGGYIKDLHRIDMSDPRNLQEFEQAINTEVERQQRVLKENDSVLPRWLRQGDSVQKFNNAATELKQLHAAQEELKAFKTDLAAYEDAHKAPKDLPSKPPKRRAHSPKPSTAPGSSISTGGKLNSPT
jgi:hypothetical protein